MLLPLFVLVLQSSWGQVPSGDITFVFTSPNTAVYDLTGTYTLNQDIVGTGSTLTPLSITDLVLTNERSGRLHGTGWIQVVLNETSIVAARYTANGRISGGGNRPTKVQLSVRLSGKDVVAGVSTGFSISVRYNLVVDPGSMALVGTARGQASFTRLPGGRISTDNVIIPLPPGVDGTWSAQMNVLATGRLGGSANVVLSNNRTLPTRLSGSFVPASGLSKVHLGGVKLDSDYDGRGTALRLNYFTGAFAPDFVNGTILGQKVVQ